MARKCHRQKYRSVLFCLVSSSGGGLPGRPELERVSGRPLFSCAIAWTTLTSVGAHPFDLRQNVALHGLL